MPRFAVNRKPVSISINPNTVSNQLRWVSRKKKKNDQRFPHDKLSDLSIKRHHMDLKEIEQERHPNEPTD